jgi:hypothetical protein
MMCSAKGSDLHFICTAGLSEALPSWLTEQPLCCEVALQLSRNQSADGSLITVEKKKKSAWATWRTGRHLLVRRQRKNAVAFPRCCGVSGAGLNHTKLKKRVSVHCSGLLITAIML